MTDTTKRILGVDPGFARIGYGAIDLSLTRTSGGLVSSNSMAVVDYGVIETTPDQEFGDRLVTIHNDMNEVMEAFKPELVVIEKFFFHKMANTILVAQARGVIALVLATHKVKMLEYTPNQIKQAITGRGNADKREVQEAVMNELGLSEIPRPDDAADALGMAVTGAYLDL